MLGSDGPVDLTSEGIQAVLARPGILDDVNSAPDVGQPKTADQWASQLMGLTLGERRHAAHGRGRRPADHRRPAAPRVLHPPPPGRTRTRQMLTLGGLRALTP